MFHGGTIPFIRNFRALECGQWQHLSQHVGRFRSNVFAVRGTFRLLGICNACFSRLPLVRFRCLCNTMCHLSGMFSGYNSCDREFVAQLPDKPSVACGPVLRFICGEHFGIVASLACALRPICLSRVRVRIYVVVLCFLRSKQRQRWPIYNKQQTSPRVTHGHVSILIHVQRHAPLLNQSSGFDHRLDPSERVECVATTTIINCAAS
jgi:hypothetical protein